MNERKCFKCQMIKPLTKEFFAAAGTGKFDRMCKVCKEQWNKEYYETHPKPVVTQHYIGKFLVRYSVREDNWTVFIKEPWSRLESFKTLDEAKVWIESK